MVLHFPLIQSDSTSYGLHFILSIHFTTATETLILCPNPITNISYSQTKKLRDMESLHLSIQMACKTISNLIHSSSGIAPTTTTSSSSKNSNNNLRDKSMKRLDQISKNVLQNALRFTGRLRVVEAPRNDSNMKESPADHQPGVTIAYALDQYGRDGSRRKSGSGTDPRWGNTRRLAACFDPLDGSGNADAAICTGTVVGAPKLCA